MNLCVNDKPLRVADPASIPGVLRQLGVPDRPCAVEVNGVVIPRAEHEHHALREGDRIEIVTLVGGG